MQRSMQEAWSRGRRRRRQGRPLLPASATSAGQHMLKPLQLLLLAVAVLLAAAPAHAQTNSSSNATTLQSDVTAITSVWGGLSPYEDSILLTWAGADADPCMGGWAGVICSCDDLPTRALAAACASASAAASSGTANGTTVHRVLGLDLGPITNAGGKKLEGRLDPALGSLEELFYLDLSNNDLTGPLPDTLSRLTKLQYLLLDGNRLSGSLPGFLGLLPNLKQAQLQNNNFSGPVPPAWCSGSAVYDVSSNPSLCGMLPDCFHSTNRISDFSGTYLSDGLGGAGGGGGACDSTLPDCDVGVGCVIWTPMYWTSRSIVNFNFTGFMDYQSGISRYQWGIGSRPNAADVVPLTPVTALRVLKDIKYSGGTQKMFVTPVVHNLTSISLLDGQSYYVTVVAWNGAGPPLSVNASSLAVLVDTTGPVAGTVYNTYTFQQASTTTSTQTLQASWDNFTDPQSGVTGYVVQFFQQTTHAKNGSVTLKQLSDPIAVKPNTNRLQVKTATLAEGIQYIAQVTATNDAGLTSTAQAVPITVLKAGDGTISAGNAALVGVLCSIGCLAIGAVLAVHWMKHRVRQHKKREKRRAEDAKQLKALMYALSSQGDVPPSGHTGSVSLPHLRRVGEVSEAEVAFVMTDIESSTELSQQDPDAFKQVQEVHDQLMREGIAKHGGYEITTEGDSFQVAFTSCHAAMAFCLDIQYRLLEQTWPKQVLALNACKVVRDPETGQALFAGPRVRMGLHWAREGTAAMRLHNLTRHKVFAGPSVQVCMDISDGANGGQILVTEEAVLQLTEDMSQAGFPVIRMLGMFQTPSSPSPMFLFSVTEVVGKPLTRQFAGLRKIKQVWPAPGTKLPAVLEFNTSMPPLPNASNSLVFVCLRLCTYPKNKKCDLPKALAARFEEVFATSAQQFKGYLFQAHENAFKEGIWTVAFQHSMDALRFTHAAQMLLMYVNWPAAAKEYSGAEIPSPDGRWLFMGPRVCMAIHESPDFFVSEDPTVEPQAPRRPMCFAGPAVTLPLVLTYAGRGGQVMLSEQAWDSVKPIITQHPGAVSIISLGMHVVSDDFPTPMLLMEVMPNLLSRRNFSRIMTKRLVEPGFRDAPDPRQPMAIVFVKVAKPQEVVDAEKGTAGGGVEVADAQISMIIQAYQLSVGKYTSVARKLLRRYNGYECKEPEPGKFTLAFKDLSDAIRWGCHLQEEIMYLDWPEELLMMQGCGAQYDQEDNLVWRGLRLRIGISWGMISTQKPLNTGRADYFGVLPNGAARVMALATPGQVLIEASNPPLDENGQLLLQQDNATFLKTQYAPGAHLHHKQLADPAHAVAADAAGDPAAKAAAGEGGGQEEPASNARLVFIHAVGYFLLRGLDNPRLLFSAETFRLQNRPLKISQDMWAPPLGAFGPGGINSSFASSRDSFRRNWSTWVERTKTSWATKRLSPRSSTSPTSNVADAFGSLTNSHSRKGGGGSVPFRPQSPSGGASTFGGSNNPLARGPGGVGSAASAGGMLEGPFGPLRSKSGLCAGAQHSTSFSSFGRGSRGALSEAGRAGMLGLLHPATGAAGGGGGNSPLAAASAGSYSSSFIGAGSSPRNLLSSSQSESAAAGRGVPNADRLSSLLQMQGGAGGVSGAPVIIDAAGPSEDESGDTPAAAASAAALADSAWQQQQYKQRRSGDAATAGAEPVRAPALMLGAAAAEEAGGAPASKGHEMTDPLLGCVTIPAIHTAVAPEALWHESMSSTPTSGSAQTDSPFAALQSGTAGSSPQAAAAQPSGATKPAQQQPHQQLQQQQRCRSRQLIERSSGGGLCLASSSDPAAAVLPESLQMWQQEQQQQPTTDLSWQEHQQQWRPLQDSGLVVVGAGAAGRRCSSPASLSTTMTSCMDADDMACMGQPQAQEAAAHEHELMSAGRADSEASLSFSGATAGMKSLLAGVAGTVRHRLSGGSGGGAPKLSWPRLFGKAGMRRHSTSSIPTSGLYLPHGVVDLSRTPTGYASDDEESVDKEVEAVQQQHGMVPRVSMHSSLSYTPGSSAAGSRVGTGGGAEQLVSPGCQFAQHLAQAYVQARHSSNASLQTLPPGYGGSQGGLDGTTSFGGACAALAGGASYTQRCSGLGVAPSDASMAGRLSSSFQAQRSSFSRGGSYTYAESSYSPKHCRPSTQQQATNNLLPAWQQQQQQEAEEATMPQRPSGQQLCPELSLRVHEALAVEATAAGVSHDQVALQINQQLNWQQQQPAGAAWKHCQQETTAARLSDSMWDSLGSCQEQLDERLVHQLQQDMLRSQQQQPRGSSRPAAAAVPAAVPAALYSSVVKALADRPDAPGLAVRLAADGGASFYAADTAQGPSALGASLQREIDQYDCDTASSRSFTEGSQQHRQLQQRHQQQQGLERRSQLLTPRAALAEGMQEKQQQGIQVWGAGEYKELVLQQRRKRSETMGYTPRTEQLPNPHAVRMQQYVYGSGGGGEAQPLPLPPAPQQQQYQQEQELAQLQEQLQMGGRQAALQPPQRQVAQQQQQSSQESRHTMQPQQLQPSSSRPSPLGKSAKNSAGGTAAAAAAQGSAVRAVASSSSHAVATAAAGGSSGSLGGVVAVSSVAGLFSGGGGGERSQGSGAGAQQPRQSAADARRVAAARAQADGRGSPSPVQELAAAGRVGAVGNSPAKRAAALLQAAGGGNAPCAAPADLPSSSSRGSSGNTSPRFASAQASPRSSLPTTPRSFSQRAALRGSSFGSAAGGGGLPGAAALAAAHGGAFLPLQRAGSSSSMPGSPKPGAAAQGLYGCWAVAGSSLSGDGVDSDDTEDGCEGGGGGLYLGQSATAVCPAGLRARTPSCTVAGQKDPLIPIPEVTSLEGRVSDPSTDPKP